MVKIYNWGGKLFENENMILNGIVVFIINVFHTQLKNLTNFDFFKKCLIIIYEILIFEPISNHIKKNQKLIKNIYNIIKFWIGVNIDYNIKIINIYWDRKKLIFLIYII